MKAKKVFEALKDVLKPRNLEDIKQEIGIRFNCDPLKILKRYDYFFGNREEIDSVIKDLNNQGANLIITDFKTTVNKPGDDSEYFISGNCKDLYAYWKYFEGADEDFKRFLTRTTSNTKKNFSW